MGTFTDRENYLKQWVYKKQACPFKPERLRHVYLEKDVWSLLQVVIGKKKVSKPDLKKIIRIDRERITELERLIPIFENGMKHSKNNLPFYAQYKLRLSELRLEYFERTQRNYPDTKDL